MSNHYITDPATDGKVLLETTLGDVEVELWSKECPMASRNFIQLCMENYYNKCIFFVSKNFIIKTGDPTNTGQGGKSIYGEDFKVEKHQRLRFNRRGLVAMAANADGLNASQFMITLDAAFDLDGKHTIFGKIAGKTIFNILRLNELVEENVENHPVKREKITGARVLSNPFPDIVPRKHVSEHKERKKERSKPKHQAAAKQNTGLLSFADDMDEDEEAAAAFARAKIRSKSAHDVLDDESLSKSAAVRPEEIGVYEPQDKEESEEEASTSTLTRIRARLRGRKRKTEDAADAADDAKEIDYETAKADADHSELQAKKDRLDAEFKALQKGYAKSMRGPKAKGDPNDDSKLSAGMREYKKNRLIFKKKTENMVMTLDPQRESQTMGLLSRFQAKLGRSSVHNIIANKKVDKSDHQDLNDMADEQDLNDMGDPQDPIALSALQESNE